MRYTISFAAASISASLAALPALAEVPKVVTDFAPATALVAQVMGDLGQPVMLLEKGASAHHFQMKPSQAGVLEEADLVVWIGPQMSPWLDKALKGAGAGAGQLVLMHVEGTHRQNFQPHEPLAEEGHDDHEAEGHEAEGHDDHDHEAEAQAEAGHDDHAGHSHEGTDPHGWLTPENTGLWLTAIAAELGKRDPENAATYGANAAAAAEGYKALDVELAAKLAPAKGKPFVVGHDAYGYFAAHYGLSVAGAVQLGDATETGAESLAALRHGLEEGGVVCLFPEVAHDPKQAQLLIDGTSVKLGGALDPEGVMQEPGPQALAQIYTGVAETLLACLNN